MKYISSRNKSDIGGVLSARAGDGAGFRIMLYSHDTFGLGHLNRNLKIAAALKNRYPQISILLATGSPQVQRFKLPDGVDYVKLPAVHKVGDDGYMPRYLNVPFKRVLAVRTNILFQTVREFEPHILLVDHSPLGMKKEILPSLEWIRDNGGVTRAMLGLRDILDDPSKTKAHWAEHGIYDVMRNLYDRIFIYGTPAVFDPVSEYGFPDDIKAKTSYCGYITDFKANDNGDEAGQREKLILVTIGGGDGGELVIDNFLKSLRLGQYGNSFKYVILTGPFLAPDIWERFHVEANELGVKILRCISEVRLLMRRSRLVISTGGYNTVTDIMCYAHKALVIPRILFRDEQLIRARSFSKMGFFDYLHPDEATPDRLHKTISEILSNNDNSLSDARIKNASMLEGGNRLSELIGESLAEIGKPEGKM